MEISTEMLVYEDMTLCTDLAHCHVVDQNSAIVLYSYSCYRVYTISGLE